jgi:hypothetical protein
MESSYSAIALALGPNCPSGFSKAMLTARLAEGFSDQEFWCEVIGKETQPDLPTQDGWKIHQELQKLQSAMTIPGQKPWSKCKFTLFPDGTFKFDVEYDD